MSPKVVLVGLPGTGKSTSGRRLAKILAVPFADSDELVESATGRSVRTIFADSGEAAFRAAEAIAIRSALDAFPGVLSLGGGAVQRLDTRAALLAAGVPVVVLRARLDTLLDRVGDGATRPLLAGGPRAALADLARVRGAVYDEIATFSVDTDGKTPGQVAATVAARLHERRVRA